MHQPFTLFKRKTKTKKVAIYYFQFRDPDSRRLTPQSTGKTNRGDAVAWAMEQFSSGNITKHKDIRFGDFTKDWFVWDTCDYLRRKRARGPYSRSYAEYQRRMLLCHILPKLATRRLDKLTAHDWNSPSFVDTVKLPVSSVRTPPGTPHRDARGGASGCRTPRCSRIRQLWLPPAFWRSTVSPVLS